MSGADTVLLSLFHGIFEFLPISSSFFLKKFFTEDFSLFLHGVCGVFMLIYFTPRIKEFLSWRFAFYAILFCSSFALHFLFANRLLGALFLFVITLVLNVFFKKIFDRYFREIFIYLFLFFFNFIAKNLFLNLMNLDISIHLFSIFAITFSLFFGPKNKNFSFDFFDAFFLGGISFFSGQFCLSKLGSLMAFFFIKKIETKQAVKFAFILAGLINLMCGLFLLIKTLLPSFHFSVPNSLVPSLSQIPFFTLGSLLAMPLAFSIIYFFEKFPKIMIVFSCFLRVFLVFEIFEPF